jgi:hypothetical protein
VAIARYPLVEGFMLYSRFTRRGRAWAIAATSVMSWAGTVYTQTAKTPAAPPTNVTTVEAPRRILRQEFDDVRHRFYTTTQGSQLVPYDWYLALEQPDSAAPFSEDHLSRYGYLGYPANKDGLPLGFVRDLDRKWLGLTCAACHTNELRWMNTTWRIDGGPTDADTWAFLRDLGLSLSRTAASQSGERFARFAAKVGAQTPASRATLFAELTTFSEYFTRFVESSRTKEPWGRARLDAFGMIFNRATGIDLNDWTNTAEPNAPVSVPFLWDTHWHNVVQWNGSAPNTLAFERLGRNVGEVLGVFASTDIKKQPLHLYFKTSARRTNLLQLEHWLSTLRSPQWPAELPPIRPELAKRGAALYANYCESCHALTPRDRPLGRMAVTMVPLSATKTDPLMATNARDRQATSGIIEGVRIPPISKLGPIPPRLPSIDLTFRVVIGAILAPPNWKVLSALAADEKGLLADLKADQDENEAGAGGVTGRRDFLAELRVASDQLIEQQKAKTNELKYKARPLDGIWATGPYLHNGSVPNLDALLKEPNERPAKFFVGTRYFDPKNVGFTTHQTAKRDGFEFDTTKPGNRNTGHAAYVPQGGTEPHTFDASERAALVEYLKTL